MFNRKLFSERVHELRVERGISMKDLGAVVGLGRSSVNYWELGDRSPSVEVLALLADYFEVSADYLMGRTDK